MLRMRCERLGAALPRSGSCAVGRGRTGTALACLAVLDGLPADEAVAYIREHYDRRAVDTPWQRRYVTHFATS